MSSVSRVLLLRGARLLDLDVVLQSQRHALSHLHILVHTVHAALHLNRKGWVWLLLHLVTFFNYFLVFYVYILHHGRNIRMGKKQTNKQTKGKQFRMIA